jgi:hypothetical protein
MSRAGLCLAVLLVAQLFAKNPFEFWPGAQHDPRIATIHQVLGYDPGEKITSSADILRYFEALAAASGRIKVFPYAESWEKRKLIYAAIGSDANVKRLAEIRADMQKLADPRKTTEAEAKALAARLPTVVWLGYGVHGNELSPGDAALLTAYHLIAARGDKMVDQILRDVLVLIDPNQNPDGRERFLHHFAEAAGPEPDASPAAAEHNEPWPGGRGNHYLFDLNRDWFALTQPETRGRIAALQEWFPTVFADLHEMEPDSTYYFAPEADPYNPHLAKDQRASLTLFGRNNAKWFDHFGFDYFTRETYDAFFPGYGASWPSYYGSVAMTYEQSTVRGLEFQRRNGTLAHYRDTVRHHFVAGVSTVEAAAQNREKLLNDFYNYRKSAIEEGEKEPIREYILPRGRDAAATDKLAGILVEQGVEVKRALEPFQGGGRFYAAGDYVVPLAQPAKRLIRTLLDPQVALEEPFVKEQERRRRQKLPHQMYDVTAWSLPLLYNVECVTSPAASTGRFEPATAARIVPGGAPGKATVAYLVPWGSAASVRLLAAAHRTGLSADSADKAFSMQGVKYPSGTLIFKVHGNPPDLAEQLSRLARTTGATVQGVNTAWVEEGVNFGSRSVVRLQRPSVALAWDTPTSATSAGAARFALERETGYPVTVIRTSQLATADLSRFTVLILPDDMPSRKYAAVLSQKAIDSLDEWVHSGGALIGISGAVSFLSNEKVELLDVAPENSPRAGKTEKPKRSEGRVPGQVLADEADLRKAILADEEQPDTAPGAILRARIDPEHWLTAGLTDTIDVLSQGRAIFTPIKLDKGVNAVIFQGADQVVVSGYLWKENRDQLAYKPLAIVERQGRGVVIGLTADPNHRGYTDGAGLLFLNAVFRSSGHTGVAASTEQE